jgi:hypothetical protein
MTYRAYSRCVWSPLNMVVCGLCLRSLLSRVEVGFIIRALKGAPLPMGMFGVFPKEINMICVGTLILHSSPSHYNSICTSSSQHRLLLAFQN